MIRIYNVDGFTIARGTTVKEALLSHLRRGRTLHFLDLKGLDLSDSDWSNVDFGESDLEGADLSFCDLTGVNFHNSILHNANLTGSKFDFSLEATLKEWSTCRYQFRDKNGQLLLFRLSV